VVLAGSGFGWQDGASSLTDDEVILLVDAKHIPAYKLEKQLDNYERGVAIRWSVLLVDILAELFYLSTFHVAYYLADSPMTFRAVEIFYDSFIDLFIHVYFFHVKMLPATKMEGH